MNKEDCKEHCYHYTGIALVSWPVQYQQKCCHCGKVEYERQELPSTPPGHGPHYPNGSSYSL
jgi:hypothetical protein